MKLCASKKGWFLVIREDCISLDVWSTRKEYRRRDDAIQRAVEENGRRQGKEDDVFGVVDHKGIPVSVPNHPAALAA